jgi:flagellar biogenesis protein FliO
MDKVVVEKEVLVPEERSSGVAASNFFWAFAMIAIVAIIVGALYYSGALRRLTSPPAQKTVNVEVQAPAR